MNENSDSARISEEAVAHVAHLARLRVTPEEQKIFSQQLSSVLDYGKAMEALNLDDVPPTSHPYPLNNVLRDIVRVKISPFSTFSFGAGSCSMISPSSVPSLRCS